MAAIPYSMLLKTYKERNSDPLTRRGLVDRRLDTVLQDSVLKDSVLQDSDDLHCAYGGENTSVITL